MADNFDDSTIMNDAKRICTERGIDPPALPTAEQIKGKWERWESYVYEVNRIIDDAEAGSNKELFKHIATEEQRILGRGGTKKPLESTNLRMQHPEQWREYYHCNATRDCLCVNCMYATCMSCGVLLGPWQYKYRLRGTVDVVCKPCFSKHVLRLEKRITPVRKCAKRALNK